MAFCFDNESLGAYVQGCHYVAVHDFFGHVDLGPKHLQRAVGADESDELNRAAARQEGGGSKSTSSRRGSKRIPCPHSSGVAPLRIE